MVWNLKVQCCIALKSQFLPTIEDRWSECRDCEFLMCRLFWMILVMWTHAQHRLPHQQIHQLQHRHRIQVVPFHLRLVGFQLIVTCLLTRSLLKSIWQNTRYASLLWPPCVADADVIFLPCGFFFFLSFFISSPNLSRCRLDVCHTSIRGMALVRI